MSKNPKEPAHGTYRRYNHRQCRCELCCEALRAYKKTYYARHPLKNRNYLIKKTYGLTPEEYEDMLFAQEGLCAICDKPMGERYFAVDHCHKTGVIRGLLCHRCNGDLGWYEIFAKKIHRYLLEAKFGKSTKRVVPVHKGRGAR